MKIALVRDFIDRALGDRGSYWRGDLRNWVTKSLPLKRVRPRRRPYLPVLMTTSTIRSIILTCSGRGYLITERT